MLTASPSSDWEPAIRTTTLQHNNNNNNNDTDNNNNKNKQVLSIVGLKSTYNNNAGAIFIGPHTPEAVGDYLAGPNHTLPTSGSARFASALCVETFMRNTSLIKFNQAALHATGAAIIELAHSEGLHSHAESVKRRV